MEISLPLKLLPGFLTFAILISLLLKPGKTISQPTATALTLALLTMSWLTSLLDWQALTAFAVITLTASLTNANNQLLRYFGWTALFLGSLALALHVIPGFLKSTIFGPETLGISELPFTLNANMDKALGALLIIFCFRYWLKLPFELRTDKHLVAQAALAITGLFTLAYFLGADFDPKIGQLSIAFIFFNLFVTCVAEESFFRLLIHRYIYQRSKNAWFAICASALLFTLAHFHTGPGAAERLSLILAAGLIYAWVYQKSNSLLAAILCHFTVNLIHFTFFVYPASFS